MKASPEVISSNLSGAEFSKKGILSLLYRRSAVKTQGGTVCSFAKCRKQGLKAGERPVLLDSTLTLSLK